MSNGSISLYGCTERSDLEILMDVIYVLVEKSKPLGTGQLTNKTGANFYKLDKILGICEKKGFVNHFKLGKREKYEFTPHGKELVYTWLDYVNTFGLKQIINSRYKEPLPEKENSILKEIMKKKLVLSPKYVRASGNYQRTPIMKYIDLLRYLKSLGYNYTNRTKIHEKINVNYNEIPELLALAFENDHIEIMNTKNMKPTDRWTISTMKKGRRSKEPKAFIWFKDQLIRIKSEGIQCSENLDKIMSLYGINNLMYTSKNLK